MSVFQSKRNYNRIVVYLAMACLCLLASIATAQDRIPKPILLKPPQKLAPSLDIQKNNNNENKGVTQKNPLAQVGGVKVDSLETVDPDTAGTLTIESGGLGADMWLGTDRHIIEELLPQLPVNSTSFSMRDLMRRLLLSIARVPEGEGKKTSLVAIRIKLLAAMGDLVSVNTLLNATPGRSSDPDLVRIETETRFLANDNARACSLAGGKIRDQSNLFWQKVFLFCQALAGEHEKASLGVSIMRETGVTDEIFFALIESLATGIPAKIENLPDPNSLSLAIARVAKAKLPADVISSNHPGVLRTIAISPNAPVEVRLEAAERAEAAGALPIDSLRQLYSIVSFSRKDLDNPLSLAETNGGPMTRALLYHTSLTQTIPTAQAEVVARALALSREEGRYISAVRVFLPVLKSIPPSAELLWFAPEAIRGLLLVGEKVAAESWFALIRTNSLFNKEVEKSLIQLMPIIRLMGYSEGIDWNTTKLSSWWKIIEVQEDAENKATLLFSLFEALGETVPVSAWDKLLAWNSRRTVSMPNLAQWLRLIEATKLVKKLMISSKNSNHSETEVATSELDGSTVSHQELGESNSQRRVGELVLLVLLVLGDDGPAGADPILLSQVISSLRIAGFKSEARSLAVEAALAAGL